MDIVLSSSTFEVTDIVRKTRAAGFKHAKVGDTLTFSFVLRQPGSNNRGQTHASYIDVKVVKPDGSIETGHHSLNTIVNYISCFDLKPV